MSETLQTRAAERRHDIDWVRLIAFDLLILYHVGMFFVAGKGWHIKNNELSEALLYPMDFINQWRLPILFVISGMGTRFALSQRTGWEFLKKRFQRLVIPLLFGMVVIVAPQVYIERIVQGHAYHSFIDFYPHYFDGIYQKNGGGGNFSWHHLWFLPYLFFIFPGCSAVAYLLARSRQLCVGPKFQVVHKPVSAKSVLVLHPIACHTGISQTSISD
ncbi:MAG: acyltransferase [Leptospiraceae bacterium]|nr:acyltransferase [Leptospiraceae bacterium]